MEEETVNWKRLGDFFVFLPGLYFSLVVTYFSFLAGTVELSTVFPWFFYLYFPALIASVYFTAGAVIDLIRKGSVTTVPERVLWVVLMLVANPIVLPVYRFSRMR